MGSILVLESDPDTQGHLEALLRAAGHDVLVTYAIREAALRLGEGGVDVVVVDSYDPRMGVVELARTMTELPEAPPLILVSGSPHAPEISAHIGAAAFVPKPSEPGEVVAAVANLLGALRPVKMFDDEEPTGPARHLG